MQVQSHCRVCPVCKAGIDDEKVSALGRFALSRVSCIDGTDNSSMPCRWAPFPPPTFPFPALAEPLPRSPSGTRLAGHRQEERACRASARAQVVPIYGRGGDHTDPRKKTSTAEAAEPKEADELVPRRPAGQRPAPIQVRARGPQCHRPEGLYVAQRGGVMLRCQYVPFLRSERPSTRWATSTCSRGLA